MEQILGELRAKFPTFSFVAGSSFCWSPERKEICFNSTNFKPSHIWSLFHETGHALLEHQTYRTDLELVRLEVAAWERARLLAQEFNIEIENDHIQDCLDTYRDWLNKRSICPTCSHKSLQQGERLSYRCFNCRTVWQVTPSRFCRAYRSTVPQAQASVFQVTYPQ